jgi:hypothetical protein
MSIAKNLAEEKPFDPLDYFPGGREGVKGRYGEAIRKSFDEFPESVKAWIFSANQTPWIHVPDVPRIIEILRGDNESVDLQTIQLFESFSSVLRLEYFQRNLFGELNLSEEQARDVAQKVPGYHYNPYNFYQSELETILKLVGASSLITKSE